jgi:biopolymer transport protein ExbD/biopolymer transport protein TolR
MDLNAEINVVSLIDVMMLLMVIFMITAPMMQGGVDISLPRAEARPLDPKSGLVVTIDKAGAIHVDETTLTFPEFRSTFRALASDRGKDGVYLRADEGVPYGTVVKVLAVMRASGTADVGLVAEQEQER